MVRHIFSTSSEISSLPERYFPKLFDPPRLILRSKRSSKIKANPVDISAGLTIPGIGEFVNTLAFSEGSDFEQNIFLAEVKYPLSLHSPMTCFQETLFPLFSHLSTWKIPNLWPAKVFEVASRAETGTIIKPHLIVVNTPKQQHRNFPSERRCEFGPDKSHSERHSRFLSTFLACRGRKEMASEFWKTRKYERSDSFF